MVKFVSTDENEAVGDERSSRRGLRKRDLKSLGEGGGKNSLREDDDDTESRRSSTGSKSTRDKRSSNSNGVGSRHNRGSSSSVSLSTHSSPEGDLNNGQRQSRNLDSDYAPAGSVSGRSTVSTRRSTRRNTTDKPIMSDVDINEESSGGSSATRVTRSRLQSVESKRKAKGGNNRPNSRNSNNCKKVVDTIKEDKEDEEDMKHDTTKEGDEENHLESDSSSADDEDYVADNRSRTHEQDSYDSNTESLFAEATLRRSRRHRKQMYHTYEESWIIGGGPEAKGYPRRRSRRLTKEAQDYANSDFGVSVNWGRDGDGTSMNEESDDMYSRVKKRHTAFKGRSKRSCTVSKANDDCSNLNSTPRQHQENEEPVSRRLRDRNKLTMSSENSRPLRMTRQNDLDVFRNHLRRKKRKRRASSSPSSSSSALSDSSDADRSPSKRRSRKKAFAGAGFSSMGQGNLSKREMLMLMEVQPIAVDPTISFQSIGGLDQFIGKLKEIVLFPLMYGEFYSMQGMRPPRGVLLHGPPGTGKTLLARALANECCSINGKKVSFFLRKGADLLNKWIGESERQLRLLFQQAARHQPSIIFFDEIDGLAPVRSSKSDQVHNSIVSTLLAELDGLQDRGQVIVVGSTNRLDFIDPALRRPGRFDCELPIFLPTRDGRRQILNVHVSKWKDIPADTLLDELADRSIGFSGADLKLLCWNASMNSLRRTYPQIYGSNLKYVLEYDAIKLERDDWELALKSVSPSTSRSLFSKYSPSQPLPLHVKPLLEGNLNKVLKVIDVLFPHKSLGLVTEESVKRLVMLTEPESGLDTYIVPALLHSMEGLPVHVLSYEALHMDGVAVEFAVTQICAEILRQSGPSVVYIPRMDRLTSFLSNDSKEILIRMINQSVKKPIFLLATIQETTLDLVENENEELMNLFHGCFLSLNLPQKNEVFDFFEPVFQQALLIKKKKPELTSYPELQLAPPESPAKKQLNRDELRAVEKQETAMFRELRIFLREVLSKIARNKKFSEFTKPVDENEVPDYLDVIQHPMDLETMMCKVNSGQYLNGNQFLEDINLISTNCLNYNPHKTDSDKRLRLRAFELRDVATKLIEEMDSDFEEQCNKIIKARAERNAPLVEVPLIIEPENSENSSEKTSQQLLPSTSQQSASATSPAEQRMSDKFLSNGGKAVGSTPKVNGILTNGSAKSSSKRRSKRGKSSWSRGVENKKKKRRIINSSQSESVDNSQSQISQDSSIHSEEMNIAEDASSCGPVLTSPSPILDRESQQDVVKIESKILRKSGDKIVSPSISVKSVDYNTKTTDNEVNETQKPSSSCTRESDTIETAEDLKEEFAKLLEEAAIICEKFTLVKLLDMRFHLLRLVEKHQFSVQKGELAQEIRLLLNTAKEKSSRLFLLHENLI